MIAGIFSDKLEIYKIVPVFKKGDPETKASDRPISSIPIFEVYETHMMS